MCPRTRNCVAAWEIWKVTIVDTVHDKMSHLRHRGVGGGPLTYRAEGNYHQNCINEPRMEGMVKFKFKDAYKAHIACLQIILGTLNIKTYYYQENEKNMDESLLRESLWFKRLPKEM